MILILLLVLIFGIFSLKPHQMRTITAAAFIMLAGVMTFKASTDPTRYDPRVEGMHILFAAIVMAAVAMLAIRVGKLRVRLEQQRGDLAEALQRIRVLATHDELTGLINRRAAGEMMRAALGSHGAEFGRSGGQKALVLIDIDHFKRVNDELGHAAGDAVLRRFAEVCQAGLGHGEVLSRWGGEEFLLWLPESSISSATAAALRLRDRMRITMFDDIRPGLKVSFSAGVADCADIGDIDDAIARADEALYAAKHAGRDQICVSRPKAPRVNIEAATCEVQ